MAPKKKAGRPRTNPKGSVFARKLGAAIRDAREARGVSRVELGKKIKRAESQIFRYESGDIDLSVELLVQICKAIDWPPTNFFLTLEL